MAQDANHPSTWITYTVTMQPDSRGASVSVRATGDANVYNGYSTYPLDTAEQQAQAAFARVDVQMDAGKVWEITLDLSSLEMMATTLGGPPGWAGGVWVSTTCNFVDSAAANP